MALNATPAAERIHIGFFGKRNAGKSSVMNAVTGQDLAIVSEQKGTTTDPVYKTMELLPLGPVMLMDTPGLDDEGALGELRVKKAYQALNKADIALVVIDAVEGPSKEDFSLLSRIQKKEIPYLIIWNKEDLLAERTKEGLEEKKRETEALFFKDEGRGFEDQRGCRDCPDFYRPSGDLLPAGQCGGRQISRHPSGDHHSQPVHGGRTAGSGHPAEYHPSFHRH